jgi:hypothetical protein
MTTELACRPRHLKKDTDGRWYSVPEVEVDAFIEATEAVENAEFMSAEWFDTKYELDNRYGCYRMEDL